MGPLGRAALLLGIAAAGGIAVQLGRTELARAGVRQRVERERVERGLSAPQPIDPELEHAYADVLARLEALQTALDGLHPSVDASHLCLPRWWAPEHRARLIGELELAGPCLADLDALLASDAARLVLECGQRASPQTPRLVSTLMWTNISCARAVVAADAGDGAEVALRIGQAMDLACLVDDGSLVARLIARSMEGTVVDALRIVAACPLVDAAGLEPLDALLRRALAPVSELRMRERELALVLEAFARARTLGEIREIGWWLDARDERGWLLGYDELLARRHIELARAALAVLAHREERGAWPQELAELRGQNAPPVDPATGEPFLYALREGGAVLAAEVLSERDAAFDLHWDLAR